MKHFILGLGLCACSMSLGANNNAPIDVITATVQTENITQDVDTFGLLKAVNRVTISPEVTGKVSTIFFKDGQPVKEGTLILQLDNTQAKAALVSAEADLELSKRNLQRYQELSKYGGTTKQELDKARADVNAKDAIVQADLNMLQKYTLTAPFDGRLGSFNVSPGDYVTPGQALVTLVNNQPLKVEYTLAENVYTSVAMNQTVVIDVSAIQNKTFAGVVTYIAPYVDSKTGTIAVQATLQNSDGLLSAGMFAHVRHIFSQSKVLVIPETAVIASLAGPYVYTVDATHVKKTPIHVQAYAKGYAQITSGLQLNDVIVAQGQQKLSSDSIIHVVGTVDSKKISAVLPGADS